MVKQLSDGELSNSLQVIYCPYTGEQVMSPGWKEFAIPNGRLIWWQCSACQGWHILLDDLFENKSANFSETED